MADKTKIVFIMTDTQGTNVVGCYGAPGEMTPRIDALAKQGMRFDKAYTTSPVCTPARSALFTGSFPHSNGAMTNNVPLGANFYTIGQRLETEGIHTAYIGKWHLDGTNYFGDGVCPAGWDPNYWYDISNYLENMRPGLENLWIRGFKGSEDIRKFGITTEDLYAHQCSERAIEFLHNHNQEDFFLVVSFDEPHGPSACPEPYCDMYRDFKFPLGDNVKDTLEAKPEHQREWSESLAPLWRKPKNSIKSPLYFGCNRYVDSEVGRVLDAIDQYAPDALVIFTSDHGDMQGAHKLKGKGPVMYEEITRIPLIIRWQGRVEPDTVCSHPTSQIDIVPTILDAFGLPSVSKLAGSSMVPVLANPDYCLNSHVFIEFHRYAVNNDGRGGFQPIRCVTDGRYKLVLNLHYSDELYDLQVDPGEMNNLIANEQYSQQRDQLHDRILDWMDETRDPLRGPIWERRSWRLDRKRGWNTGKTDAYQTDKN